MGVVVAGGGSSSLNSLLSRNEGNGGLLLTTVVLRAFTLTTAFDLFLFMVNDLVTLPEKRSGERSAANSLLFRVERRSNDSEDEGGVAIFFFFDGGMVDTDGAVDCGEGGAVSIFDLLLPILGGRSRRRCRQGSSVTH
jgi:hypothetical protein